MKFKCLLSIYVVYIAILAYSLTSYLIFTYASPGDNKPVFHYPEELPKFKINTTKPWRTNLRVIIRFEISEELKYINVTTQLGLCAYIDNPGHLIPIICTYYCNNAKIGKSEFHIGDGLKMKLIGHFDEIKIPTEVLRKGENIVIIDISITGKVTKRGYYSFFDLKVVKEWPVGLSTNIEPFTYVKITLKDSDNDGVPDKYDTLSCINNGLAFFILSTGPLPVLVKQKLKEK